MPILEPPFPVPKLRPTETIVRDRNAAERADAMLNRLFIEPSLGLGYPWDTIPVLKRIQPYMMPGDAERSVFDFDFIGIQNYTREKVKHSYFVPILKGQNCKSK